MCCFAQPVDLVQDTQIFARLTGTGTQYLVYQMNYESATENAMILPIPVRRPAREDSVRFIDLKGAEDFFADLDKGFPYRRSRGISLGCSAERPVKTAAELAVFDVGNYVASFVPTIADFVRLDERFRLPEQAWSKLPHYKDFGFAVFQLVAGALKPHPMAFEFPTALDSIFFPTVHIHDGKVHETEEFDHALYLQHAGFDSRVGAYRNSHVPDDSTGLIRSSVVAKGFCELERAKGMVDGSLLVHRRFLSGDLPNRDTEITVTGDPTQASMNLKSYFPSAAWMLVAGAVTWFLGRRGKLKGIV